MDNMGCCKNPYQGLEVPVYLSTIDPGNGKITDRNFEAARLHFDVVPACQCPCDNTPISGRVVKAGVAYPVVSHGGPSACPQCIADADMTVNSTTLKGTLYPCCVQPCCDIAFVRPVEGEPGAGMYRWVLQPCASGPGRDPVQPFRRMPCCVCPGGAPIGVQTYSMQLPAKKRPPEVRGPRRPSSGVVCRPMRGATAAAATAAAAARPARRAGRGSGAFAFYGV